MAKEAMRRRGGVTGVLPKSDDTPMAKVATDVAVSPAPVRRASKGYAQDRPCGYDMRVLTSRDIQTILIRMGLLEKDGSKLVNGMLSWIGGDRSTAVDEEWEGHGLRSKLPQLLSLAFWSLTGAWHTQQNSFGGAAGAAIAGGTRVAMNEYIAQGLRGEFVKWIEVRGPLGLHVDWTTLEVKAIDRYLLADKYGVREGWTLKSIAVGSDGEPLEPTRSRMIEAEHADPFVPYELVFISDREKYEILRVQIALEDAMYAVSREYGGDSAKHADVVDAVYYNQALHTSFAFYYKHPLYSCRRWFLFRVLLEQLWLSIYSWWPLLDADHARGFSSQARLLRHSIHRHGLTGFAVTILLGYVMVSFVGLLFDKPMLLFDKDLHDESVIAFLAFFVHMVFGGL